MEILRKLHQQSALKFLMLYFLNIPDATENKSGDTNGIL
jgi:hypothetical protein